MFEITMKNRLKGLVVLYQIIHGITTVGQQDAIGATQYIMTK